MDKLPSELKAKILENLQCGDVQKVCTTSGNACNIHTLYETVRNDPFIRFWSDFFTPVRCFSKYGPPFSGYGDTRQLTFYVFDMHKNAFQFRTKLSKEILLLPRQIIKADLLGDHDTSLIVAVVTHVENDKVTLGHVKKLTEFEYNRFFTHNTEFDIDTYRLPRDKAHIYGYDRNKSVDFLHLLDRKDTVSDLTITNPFVTDAYFEWLNYSILCSLKTYLEWFGSIVEGTGCTRKYVNIEFYEQDVDEQDVDEQDVDEQDVDKQDVKLCILTIEYDTEKDPTPKRGQPSHLATVDLSTLGDYVVSVGYKVKQIIFRYKHENTNALIEIDDKILRCFRLLQNNNIWFIKQVVQAIKAPDARKLRIVFPAGHVGSRNHERIEWIDDIGWSDYFLTKHLLNVKNKGTIAIQIVAKDWNGIEISEEATVRTEYFRL